MYETIETFKSDGTDLKQILKSCIFNYYMKEKNQKDNSKDLQNKNNHRIIEATNKQMLSEKKGVLNVF